jgi:serine/threonine-protein kinase ULK2
MGCCFSRVDENSFEYSYEFDQSAVLGTGGFAKVKKARNKTSLSYVAVKIIDIGKLNKRMIDLVSSEVSIMKELDHVNIVKCYDFFAKPTEYYVVMELMEVSLYIF